MAGQADLFWSLPPIVSYNVGAELPVSISVLNLTEERREYMLLSRTFDRSGRQISEKSLPVMGRAWFEVEAGDREVFDGALSPEETDVGLVLSLIERETGEEVGRASTWLQRY